MTKKQKYREFCKKEKNIPIFSKDWWLDSVCGKDNWDIVLVEKGGQIIASLPYYKTKKAFFEIISMPKLTQNMGVYLKYPENQKYEKRLSFEKEVVTELIDQIPIVDSFSQNFHYNFNNWLPLYWKDFKQTTRYTYVIVDLLKKSEDDILKDFHSSYRNKIKKAQKAVVVKKGLSIESFYEINMKTFERQNIDNPYSLEFIKGHDERLHQNKAREIFYAEDESGNIHSALYLTWDKNSSYVHMVGEDPQLRKSAAGILLVLETIRYTKDVLKLDNYDFEGSMLENIEHVRRSFGAIQKPYFNISKTNSKVLKIRQVIKEIMK
ncbi:GNAT family N-acetyltransferase [Sulfurovum sp. XGS-02]|uniref:GNAT family N-acetyltransferase n=1 Tax=Sulfurovum sp. XGS-02 TaxID=2925411 RepID=UPI00206FD501|nr:GNAT family N-acetyltransferase [Sulfurovum sp. XGS-02]UPT77639.1 GNAT family N-acetyltransferase [Sulfurovum sp. XGS-02]